MKNVLFEDEKYTQLMPMVYFRPVWELRCGARMLSEKISEIIGKPLKLVARDYLQQYHLFDKNRLKDHEFRERLLLINGRWVMEENDLDALKELAPGEALLEGDTVLACVVPQGQFKGLLNDGVLNSALIRNTYTIKPYQGQTIDYLWDAVNLNGKEIVKDFQRAGIAGKIKSEIPSGVHLLNKEEIYIGENVSIKPGVVIDASDGPVWIEDNVTVMANAVLQGPLYIGKGSTIKIAAKIYENTTIGPVCKMGGEVEGSIIQGYSNKQHDGFLGHAYLGEWVNLGADTNNSDLKNNYGTIKVFVNGKPVDTGSRFVGLMMGDHSKSGINTMFNTGTIVGISCNVFGAGMPQKFVPSFSWGSGEQFKGYHFEKAIAVAETVMGRRKVAFDENQAALFKAARALAAQLENESF